MSQRSVQARYRRGRRALGGLAVAALGATLAVGHGGAALAGPADDGGIVRYDAYIDDDVRFLGFTTYSARCPDAYPYLKRFHTGTYDPSVGDIGRGVPSGVLVYEGNGPVYLDGSLAERSEHTGAGPSGWRAYEAFRGITGDLFGFGGSSVRVVLWCVSDPFNGAVGIPWGTSES